MNSPIVAVIGGGQLARMMQQAAIPLGIQLRVQVDSAQDSAAQVVPDAPIGAASSVNDVRQLVQGATVLTFEHEHVPQEVLDLATQLLPVYPGADALHNAQDKVIMRRNLTERGIPCPRWKVIENESDFAEFENFASEVGLPLVAKVSRGGYDGKGVRLVNSWADISDWIADPTKVILIEEKVPFTRELAVLLARRPSGEVRAWPVVETIQQEGVCFEVLAPAPDMTPQVAAAAQEIGQRIASELGVVGVLAVEMFLVEDNGQSQLYVNELAMRPHNSGHWTINGALTSQFEQHLRAVLDLPLGETTLLAPAVVMTNLLGSKLDSPGQALAEVFSKHPRAQVHLYGKEVRPGRKLGHVTVLADSIAEARRHSRDAITILKGES